MNFVKVASHVFYEISIARIFLYWHINGAVNYKLNTFNVMTIIVIATDT